MKTCVRAVEASVFILSTPWTHITWALTIKAHLEPLSVLRVFGYARWRKEWAKVSSEIMRDRLSGGGGIYAIRGLLNK